MAEAVGELAVRVGADVTPLKSGMRSASNSVGSFSAKASRDLKKVTGNIVAMGAAATAAGAAAVTALYAKQSQVIDSLAKTSDALGTTIVELQALNRVAELNGVSSEQMAKGLQRMEVRLGEAARRGGSAAQALNDIGINLDSIQSKSPAEQIEQLSMAIGTVENQSLKASIATDLFGRDGLKMLKVLNQIQKEGLQPTIDNLEKFGIAMSRVDAAQVEAANDAWLKAEEVLGGVANKITIELAPYVEELASKFTEAAGSGVNFGEIVVDSIQKVVEAIAFTGDIVHGLKVVFKGLELVAVSFGAAAVTAFELVGEGIATLVDFQIGQVNKLIGALNEIPKVDIATIDPFSDSAFMEGLRTLGFESRETVAGMRSELHEMAMQELPSDKIKAFFEQVKTSAKEAGTEISNTAQKFSDPFEGEDPFGGENPFDMSGYVTENRKEMAQANADTRRAFGDILNTVGQHNKKAFKISKAYAIADTLVSTAQGIAKGVSKGLPAGLADVAWASATGLAQLSAIQSQQYNGGTSSGGGGASTAATASQAPAPSPQAQQGQTLTISPIDPNAIFSGSQVASLGERIYDYSKDGGDVVFQT